MKEPSPLRRIWLVMDNRHRQARRIAREVARRLFQLAGDRDWSLCRLAAEAGVSRELLYRVARGATCPSFFVCLQLCGALGVSLWQVIRSVEESPA